MITIKKSDNDQLLAKYFNRASRLVLILGSTNYTIKFPIENSITFEKPDHISLEKLSYLRADLIILGNYQSILKKDDIEKILEKYSHEAGVVFFLNEDRYMENLICNKKFQKTKVKHLYAKKTGYTPKEYDIDYLKRWGDTDFLKNWKIAGEQILIHTPENLDKTTMTVLDVGCLNGYIMETLKKHGVKNIFGNDISYEIAINHCINKYHLPAITIGDFCENNYPDNFSDMTIAMEILEHIPLEKTDLFISQLKRVTSDKGVILISASEDINVDPTHVNCRKRSEWYYEFCKHGLIPEGKQTIFPGFNSFVLKKASVGWKVIVWKFIYASIKLLNTTHLDNVIFKIKQYVTSKLLDEKFANITYSQCGEDVIIKHIFNSLTIHKPSYMDIGAYSPFSLNNTALFYLSGGRGINIEPSINNYKYFLRYRKGDINLNIGIAGHSGFLNYYEMSVPSLNTLSKKDADNYAKEGYQIKKISKIRVETVSNIVKLYWNDQFPNLLSIDAEGLELEILKSIDFKKTYPIVICVETISFSISGKGKKNTQVIKFIEDQGYLLYADTNINSIFVKKDVWMNR